VAKLLVIDDDPRLLRAIELVLREAGHQVCSVQNGVEGLHAFRRQKPDLVITDILMPVKGGLDTIDLLRAWAPKVKIIAISGGAPTQQTHILLAKASNLGVISIMAKPFSPAELLDKVQRSLAE
jgi:CheY-like chemotaxis protein